MQNLGNKKPGSSEFICKLQDMMAKHPSILGWSENGKELVVKNVSVMQEEVLPSYFRHRNFGSFVRQLNMYNFHKVSRQNNSMNFLNELFFAGNEMNFYLIERKKKSKEEEKNGNNFEEDLEPVLTTIQEDQRLTGSVKNLIKNLIHFKYIAVANQKKIRKLLDSICKDLKQSRSKRVNTIVTEIKQNSIEKLDENLNISKNIDAYIQDYFLKDLTAVYSNSSIPLLEENNTINQIMMVDAKNINFHSANSLMNLSSSKKDFEAKEDASDSEPPSIEQRMKANLEQQ